MDKEEREKNVEKHMEEFLIVVKEIKERILNLLEEHPNQFFSAEEILNHLGISIEKGFPSIAYSIAFDAAWAKLVEEGLIRRIYGDRKIYGEEKEFLGYGLGSIGNQVEKWLQKRTESEKS
jgi:hypothetical protein